MRFHETLVAVSYGAILAVAAPKLHGPERSFLAPRQSTLDWNAPRADEAGFLRKRDDVHSIEFFNRKRSVPSSGNDFHSNPSYEAAMHKRATSGQWENINGTLYSYPSACSWGGKRVDVYYKGKTGSCQHRSYDGSKWGSWEDMGGSMDSPPATCSYDYGKMDVYTKGTDGGCWKKSYTDNKWNDWEPMGGDLAYEPSVCAYGKESHVYAPAKDGQCYYKKYSSSTNTYTSWYSLGGYLDGPPKAVTWGSDHQSVVCKGNDGQMWHKRKYSNGWGSWESLGGYLAQPPSACAWDNRVEVFVMGDDGHCWGKSYKNDKWGDWYDMGGDLAYAPEVVQYEDKMEVYATYKDGGMYRKSWSKEKWTSSWEYMGGSMKSKPSPVYYDSGKVDVYGWGKDNSCKRCY